VSVAQPRKRRESRPSPLAELDRRFEAIVFDWDGTAVSDRKADCTRLRELVEAACGVGLDLAVVTGTHVGNVENQLKARPTGPGRLYLCVNRGSEVFRADETGVHLLERREADAGEEAALDEAAIRTVALLGDRGLHAEVVSQRLNRRKIDLIPEPTWSDPPKARIAELLAAVEARLNDAGLCGLGEAVQLAQSAAEHAGLTDARVTSDAKHVEIGLTDKADAARWVFGDLWKRGIAPGLVLVAGDEFGPLGGLPGSDSLLLVDEGTRAAVVSVGAEPTGVPEGILHMPRGPEAFRAVLADQLERRLRGDPPDVDRDPSWTVTIEGLDTRLERVHETMLAIASGRLGTRGAPLLAHPAALPATLAAGVYEGEGPETELACVPDWALLRGELPRDPLLRRRLDLHSGVLRQEVALPGGALELVQLASLADPGAVALRAAGPASALPPTRDRAEPGALTGAFAEDRRGRRFDRYGAYDRDPGTATELVRQIEAGGFERVLTAHREAWAQRWEHADVIVDGDPDLQHAIRFSLFHLMGSVDGGEAAVGARGLTGPGYRGHVFWDSDVFVLPFLAATNPTAARAMLEYRVARLPTAREAARKLGRAGARFPWESAASGTDVTPTSARDQSGRLIRIRTGELEEHIVADVAWAAKCYLDWTGDDEFAAGPGRDLIVETARYWASRVRTDGDGRAHIYGVIGPDEYHESVDDNAFTNVMARWNLRAAAGLDGISRERAEWLRLADALVDGFDPATGIYEQFAGFHRLEPLIVAEVAPRRPIAADLLLGAERVCAAQVLKQADVLMLHHLVPDEVKPGSLAANLSFYEPRTAHGSSLSPAIHAGLFARAGRLEEAVETLEIAARIDLDDLTGTTAGGVHLATMGGFWQAIAFGFAGIRPRGEALLVAPRLPDRWGSLEFRLRFRGRPFALIIDNDSVSLRGPGLTLCGGDGTWEVTLQ
jgi:trehalose/maltose hydrolase-like predicted phosphorylase